MGRVPRLFIAQRIWEGDCERLADVSSVRVSWEWMSIKPVDIKIPEIQVKYERFLGVKIKTAIVFFKKIYLYMSSAQYHGVVLEIGRSRSPAVYVRERPQGGICHDGTLNIKGNLSAPITLECLLTKTVATT